MARLALIGVGQWGANLLRTISASEHLTLAAVVSRRSREDIETIVACEAPIFRDFRDLTSMAPGLDGVVLATPPRLRAEQIDFFLDQRVPIFTEKPMSLWASESCRLLDKSEELDVPLIEDFVHVYSWPYQTMRARVTRRPLRIESCGGNDGPIRDYSPLLDYGPHDVAMVLDMFRREPVAIDARATRVKSAMQLCICVDLDFGSDGTATIAFGNAFETKCRVFSVLDGSTRWVYDDLAADKLTANGEPVEQRSRPQPPLARALHAFVGVAPLLSRGESVWLSRHVAAVLDRIGRLLT